MRVHELAKELGLPSKDVTDRLIKLGASVHSHMSTVDDATAANLRKSVKGTSAAKPAQTPVPAA
ncbi:MAG: translation initiation factor IF-2 N-terminal domain-containing protein, partial [bacterium]